MKFLPLIIIVFTSLHCAKGGSSSIVGDPNLAFTWESDCITEGGRNFILTLENTGKESKRTKAFFYDDKCESASDTDIWSTQYALGDKFVNAQDVFRINFTIKKAEKIYTNDAEINTANTSSAYGYDDWSADESKDVTGKKYASTGSDAQPDEGQIEYQIFQVADDILTLGDMSLAEGTSEETRPKKLSTLLILHKQ
ncbi:MAG: hypothetical protein AB7T49_03475 [Oligoflexales bacterium]